MASPAEAVPKKRRPGAARKERLSASAIEKLHEIELSPSETVSLAFEEGPLGLQILDVPRKGVLVWHLSGQAAALGNGALRVGSRVEAVAGVSCENKDLEDVFELVKKNPRPLEITFRLPMASRPNTPGDAPVPAVDTSRASTPSSTSSSSTSASKPSSKAEPVSPSTPPGQTQVRLEPVKRSVSTRLRNFTESDAHGKSQELSKEALDRAQNPRRKDDTVCVVFRSGPLGLQISDVGKRVLVTSFENNPDGSMGQAEKSGMVHFGYQVVKVGQSECEGMSMHQIGMLVQKQKRPVAITFRKLYERRNPADDPARARRRRRSQSKSSSTAAAPAPAAQGGADAEPVAVPPSVASGMSETGSLAGMSESEGEPEALHGESATTATPEDEDAEEEGEQNVMTECECGNVSMQESALSNTDPMYFHFVMLCKSSQIQILLDHEATLSEATDPSKHPAFELSSLHMPTLYKRVNAEEIQFPDWPTWIRMQYLDAYISQSQRVDGEDDIENPDDLSPEQAAVAAAEIVDGPTAGKPGAETSEKAEHDERLVPPNEQCAYCKAKRALRQRANTLNDDMYIHFALLFKTVKIQAENSTRNQEGYVEYLSSVDVEDLYRWCQKDGISMHEWMQWIKKQCAISYEEYLYKIALSGDVEIDLRDMIKESVPA
ncbi:Hypothetical Protein FCC1311_096932 [Hondaea fermentalgiana]|uniref:PDZ domain-containing protein n=1 Tax=Hondaea fermentalgiana TaxID=2315210 RepID=A0A2R5GRJ7_9STRA|nr:Hypothetical Protein FCC1311_096932 [Hondaea fermentalgiana]|eukprot:GBG33470.1 Hypothetical Protein FCC1311_096932 [Hondaea fermentalgiana]